MMYPAGRIEACVFLSYTISKKKESDDNLFFVNCKGLKSLPPAGNLMNIFVIHTSKAEIVHGSVVLLLKPNSQDIKQPGFDPGSS